MTENDSKLPAKRPLKVVLVCHSDLLGGASIVTYRLMNALRHEGVDARMLVYTKTTQSPEVDVISSRFNRGFRFMAERLEIMAHNGFSYANLFKVSTASLGERGRRDSALMDQSGSSVTFGNQKTGTDGQAARMDNARHVVSHRNMSSRLRMQPLRAGVRLLSASEFCRPEGSLPQGMEEESGAVQT